MTDLAHSWRGIKFWEGLELSINFDISCVLMLSSSQKMCCLLSFHQSAPPSCSTVAGTFPQIDEESCVGSGVTQIAQVRLSLIFDRWEDSQEYSSAVHTLRASSEALLHLQAPQSLVLLVESKSAYIIYSRSRKSSWLKSTFSLKDLKWYFSIFSIMDML